MRKPSVVLGVAALALVAGGFTARALAYEPPVGQPGEAQRSGDRALPGHDATLTGWGGAPSPSDSSVSPPGREPSADGPSQAEPSRDDPSRDDPSRDEPSRDDPTRGEPSQGRFSLEAPAEEPLRRAARPAGDPIAASRTAITAASVSSSPQAPVQQQILALANRHRRDAGCGPLTLDRRLIEAANRHAADMARRGYFDHESPRGERAGSRVTDAGYEWSRYGENIARGQDSPYQVMNEWMESPGHRRNILDCRLDQMGVGLALSDRGTPYWVQELATPR
ncbi:CAP domain-containing protein [Actinoplanes sp. NPDC049802]|uniref:CAP domain-containing protein n=1 Tax=Actinoplanes sp. NPDC049802 TaxID=3154742 RepID=UPI0033C96C8A